jgi:hypothetical protein
MAARRLTNSVEATAASEQRGVAVENAARQSWEMS